MKILTTNKDKIILEINEEELTTLSNSLNEVCNGMDVLEFDTKIGVKMEEASQILQYLISVHRQVDRSGNHTE